MLLNERGEVSECTSANLFAVFKGAAQGDRVLTPPLSSGCLPGVTRAVLLEELRVSGLVVEERVLLPADLESADEVFLASTTRELLPVVSIEGLRIHAEPCGPRPLTASLFRVYRILCRSAEKVGSGSVKCAVI